MTNRSARAYELVRRTGFYSDQRSLPGLVCFQHDLLTAQGELAATAQVLWRAVVDARKPPKDEAAVLERLAHAAMVLHRIAGAMGADLDVAIDAILDRESATR